MIVLYLYLSNEINICYTVFTLYLDRDETNNIEMLQKVIVYLWLWEKMCNTSNLA